MWLFDEITTGDTHAFGSAKLTTDDIEIFHDRFAPHLPREPRAQDLSERGRPAAQAHIYALWARMLFEETDPWPIFARLGQDAIRHYKSAYAGDELTVRLTLMTKDEVGHDRGIIVTQHDVLNQDGELVMSLLTRTVLGKRAAL